MLFIIKQNIPVLCTIPIKHSILYAVLLMDLEEWNGVIMEKNVIYYAGLLTGAWLLGLAGESIYAPAMPQMANNFSVSDTFIKLTITSFILGKTISMWLCSPIAEAFGRRQFILFGLLLLALGGLVCTISSDIHILYLGRLLQGLGCSITILMGRAIVNDSFESCYAARVFSYIFTGNAIGIFVLPILGGYMAAYFHWRWIFFILTCYGLVIFALLWRFLPQTNPKVSFSSLKPRVIIGNYKTIIQNGPFWGFLLCVAFMMAGEKAYTTAAAFLFIKTMGISKIAYGYLTAGIWVAHLLGALLSGWLAFKLGIDRLLKLGVLLISIASFIMLMAGLLAWNSVYIFVITMLIYMLGTGFIIVPAAVGIVRPFPQLIGFATAFAMAMEFSIGSGISYFITRFPSSVIPIELTVSGMGALTFLSWMVFLYRSTQLETPNGRD